MALMGRVTDVINLFGQKVSPETYEDDLRERLGVSGVCIFGRQNDEGEEEAHVVLEAPAPLSHALLGAAIRRTLVGFPLIRIHYLTALPRNANGKVLRLEARRAVGP